jgi:hypothetical protein
MTPASRAALGARGSGNGGGRRRRRKTKAKRSRKTRSRAGGRKIKFGSPAWRKKYNLGKKRRRK